MRKILVLRGGALGDLLVTLPALALLRQRWPDARIELAGNATAAALALEGGLALRPDLLRALLDAVHSQHEARWSALFAAGPLTAEFAAWLAEFDLVVNFWPDPDGVLRAKFPLHVRQTFLHGEAHPARAPAAAHYCDALRPLGLETKNYHFALPAKSSGSSVESDPLIAIHPGSGSPRKNWPLDRWLELISALPPPVVIILGEAEIEAWSGLTSMRLARGLTEQRIGNTPLHLAIDLPLRELALQLARCRLFLGHDSGVSHLAAACGTPCVLLFGPTDPAMWAPPAPHVQILRRGPDMSAISVADVRQALNLLDDGARG